MVGMFNGDALLNGVIMNGKDRVYKDKLLKFAVRIVKLKNYLNEQKHEYNIADQIQRSGTSIGANHREAIAAESEADYLHKLGIARKEANETIYWLKLIHQCGYIDAAEFQNLADCAEELIRILTSIIVAIKKKHTI